MCRAAGVCEAAWTSLFGAITPCVTLGIGLCLSARDWKPLSFSQNTVCL